MSVKYIPLPHSLFLTENIKLDEIPSKIKQKVHAYWFHFVSSFEVTSYKMIQLPVFYFCLFLHQQIPFFYIFYHFIQRYLKKDFRHKLLLNFFLTDSHQPSNLHNNPNLLSMTKAFFICYMASHGQLLTTVEETASLIRCKSPFPYSKVTRIL